MNSNIRELVTNMVFVNCSLSPPFQQRATRYADAADCEKSFKVEIKEHQHESLHDQAPGGARHHNYPWIHGTMLKNKTHMVSQENPTAKSIQQTVDAGGFIRSLSSHLNKEKERE